MTDSNLRELLSLDIASGDLSNDPNAETGADRIAALARCNKLGAALWRVTGNLDPHEFRAARAMLASALHAPIHDELLLRLCQCVLEEWLTKVKGSDSARRAHLGISQRQYHYVRSLFDLAHVTLEVADARVARQVALQLERPAPKPLLRKSIPGA